MKITKKQMEMIKKVLLLLLLIVFGFFLCSLVFNTKSYSSEGPKRNQIENFLAYPNKQKFCPTVVNSKSRFWTPLPKEYSNGLMCKFCCTKGCALISKEIVCGKNTTGDYKICSLKETDIDNLQQYYNKEKNNLDFEFPSQELYKLKGSMVLKKRREDGYYPIQILKTEEQLNKHEENPTIANHLYRDSFKCI